MGSHHQNDDSNELLEKQMAENDQQLEAKRAALAQQQMQIIHNAGAQQWTPTGLPMQPINPATTTKMPQGML